jgi:hypothetical protein
MRKYKRPLFVSVVAVMLCLIALAEYKYLRSIFDRETLLNWVFGASAVQLASTVTCLVSLLCAVVTAVGLWGMRSWAMACYTAYAVVAVAEVVVPSKNLIPVSRQGFGSIAARHPERVECPLCQLARSREWVSLER